ncbi:MAG: hypothetical protein J0H98_08130 [Solirubrobacterales bacterium]|nr:hypothetical protein [Solirubrobacterales bacterium]
MALSLSDAAVASQNNLQRGVIEVFVNESVILDRIPMLEINGNAYAYNKEATLPGVEFRAVNNGYTESTGTIVQATESLVILGGDADVDRFIQQTRSNINDQRAIQTALKVKAATRKFQDAFFNGDVAVDVNGFDGLKKRLTGSQVIDAATDGLPVLGSTSADRQTFFDKLDELIASVPGGPDALYMNASIRSKILSAMRRENQYVEPVGVKKEASYQGIPLLDAGKVGSPVGSQTNILPQTETQGTATSQCSSIYAVKWSGDEADNGVGGLTNGGVQVDDLGELDSKPVLRTRIEFYCGVATWGLGAARLRGIKNA